MQEQSITTASIKVAPPIAVTAYNYVLGLPIEKWVAAATFVYVVLQTFVLLRNELKKWRDRRDQQ